MAGGYPALMPHEPTPDLDRLLRWEDSGGTWQVAARRKTGPDGAQQVREEVTLSLLTCDGGEEMDVLTSSEQGVLDHVRSAGPTGR